MLKCFDMYIGFIVVIVVFDLNFIVICINIVNELLICDCIIVYKWELIGVIVLCCSVFFGWNVEVLVKFFVFVELCGFFLFFRYDDNR